MISARRARGSAQLAGAPSPAETDGNLFQDSLSDDHVEVGTTGIATKAQVVAYVASGACVVSGYTVEHFHVTRSEDNTALLTYRAEQSTTCGKATVPSPTWEGSLFVRPTGSGRTRSTSTLEQR